MKHPVAELGRVARCTDDGYGFGTEEHIEHEDIHLRIMTSKRLAAHEAARPLPFRVSVLLCASDSLLIPQNRQKRK